MGPAVLTHVPLLYDSLKVLLWEYRFDTLTN